MRGWIVGMVFTVFAMGAAAQQTVSFTSPVDTFRLNSTATGTVTKNRPFLKVRIDQHVMWQPKKYVEPTTIIGFRVGVAGFNELGQWDTFRSSAIVPYSHKFKSGETVQVPASSVLIPIDGLKTLKDKWLVLTMVQNHKDGEARTHAHTDELTLELTP